MKKIKEIISNTFSMLKKLFNKVPITIITVAITTILLTILLEQKGITSKVFMQILLFGTIFSIESFFTESYFTKKYLRIIFYIISAIISFGFTTLIYSDKFANLQDNLTRILAGYLLILILLSLYRILKKEKLNFQEYTLKVFANVFNSTIIYGILAIGITLLSIIFIKLILNGEYGFFIIRTNILLLGLFYIPSIINAVLNVTNKEVSLFIKGLIKYVLLPLVTIGILIIYLYIIKILLLRQIPSNIIFRILAGIFSVTFPVWNMAENFTDENKFTNVATKILPYSYMPFILLEIYSLGIRIVNFGITPTRYFGLAFMILQIIALILTVIKNKKKLHILFICASIIIGIAFITPINYDKVSLLSQRSILIKCIKEDTNFENITKEDKEKAIGAYVYLNSHKAKNYIPDYIWNFKDELTYNNYEYQENTDYIYLHLYNEETNINIKEYSKLIEVNQYATNDITNVELYDKNRNLVIKVNLENIITEEINANKNNQKERILKNNVIKIDESKDLYIQDINYNKYAENMASLSVSGYVLEK